MLNTADAAISLGRFVWQVKRAFPLAFTVPMTVPDLVHPPLSLGDRPKLASRPVYGLARFQHPHHGDPCQHPPRTWRARY
jgi:hypothetical protein